MKQPTPKKKSSWTKYVDDFFSQKGKVRTEVRKNSSKRSSTNKESIKKYVNRRYKKP